MLQSTTILRTSSDKTFAFRSRSLLCGNRKRNTISSEDDSQNLVGQLDMVSLKDDFVLVFVFFLGGSYHGATHVDLCESKADCTKQTVTFLLKAWALLPKAASVGGCLAFSVSLGLKRAPEERFTYKRVNKFGVTNSSIFVFISFLLEPHVHYSPE